MRGKNNLNRRRVANDNITNLCKKEVFVFGSNKKGHHSGGAAKFASDHFGAQWGVGEGKTGRCYAIPTMEGITSFRAAIIRFIRYARTHQDRIFLVTKVGCGIAGYTVEQVAPMFRPCIQLDNVYLPAEFFNYYTYQ